MNTLDEIIEIVQACKDGRKIQFLSADKLHWHDVAGEPSFCFDRNTYRIKPELVECWVNVDIRGTVLDGTYLTKNVAEAAGGGDAHTIKVREVVEE